MPMGLNRYEMNKFNDGLANALSRLYDPAEGCPHKPGTVLALTYAATPGAPEQPIARVTVVAVERSTVGARAADDRAALMEGCSDAREWTVNLRQRYGARPDHTPVWQLRLRVDERFPLKA